MSLNAARDKTESLKFEYDARKAARAQSLYCETKRYPRFAPGDGQCWRCAENIYENINERSIDVAQAANRLVICCPYCGTSFCE